MYFAASSRDRSLTVGCVGHVPELSAPAALLLLPLPHPCCLFIPWKLVAYRSHLTQLFKDMPCMPTWWMASFHLIWFMEPKSVIRPSLQVLLLLAFLVEAALDIWIVLETEVAAVGPFLLHSIQPLSCKFKLPVCTLYPASVLVAARGT